jgi:NADPH2:quinone reductase
MKAWQIKRYGEPRDAIERVDTSVPEPGAGEVRIRVDAAAIGLPDVFMCRGSYVFNPELPFTPGQEVSGTVVAVGEGVQTAVGERVMGVTSFFRGFGGLAEEALALDLATHPTPAEMDPAEAGCFAIPYQTAYIGLVTRAQLAAGENLIVLGAAGGTGTAAIQLGCALGARVIAVAAGPAKARLCRELGAHVVIDHSEVAIADGIMEATSGAGADVIYDPVGGEACAAALSCIASEGRMLSIGFASGSFHNPDTEMLTLKNASMVGVYVGAYSKPFTSEVHDALLSLWREKQIGGIVSRRVRFEDAAEALEDLAQRRAMGKLVVCD